MSNLHVRVAALVAVLLTGGFLLGPPASGGVSTKEADELKSTLTPFGAERGASKDGTIPAWTGTVVTSAFREDPFKDKAVVTIAGKNAAQYAGKLSDGIKAMLAKYPDYRIDVYPTHRTATAPQWVYDNTYQNALHGKLNGYLPEGVFGGIPFPIPKNGIEAMWNHLLRYRPGSWQFHVQGIETTADGKHVVTLDGLGDQQMPYYLKGEQKRFNGDFWLVKLVNLGPPIRAGAAIVDRENVNEDKTRTWVYLVGQRRVRELPNPCCDTPAPPTAGEISFDEIETFTGRLDRFDWKLVGKRELYVPYNDNAVNSVSNDLLLTHFVNPDHVRWELHRVWVVDASLRAGQRHQSPRARYYLDEDSWMAVLSDRYDAHNQLWRVGFTFPFQMSGEEPSMASQVFGVYDLLAATWYFNGVMNAPNLYFKRVAAYPDDSFTPDAMMRGAR